LRADTPMTLVPRDLEQLSGLIEDLSISEVEQIYLPLSRLLNLHVAGAQELHSVTSRFLGRRERHVPYILGIAGSVAVGKSTTARVLRALLARWADHPRVDLITTDGFLYPNAELERRGIMHRKGFPESFDTARLLNFLHQVKSGRENVEAPVYSHFHYDIIPGQTVVVDRPDILIVEGLNVLQPARLPKDGEAIPFVSDFFNFSIYLDADPKTGTLRASCACGRPRSAIPLPTSIAMRISRPMRQRLRRSISGTASTPGTWRKTSSPRASAPASSCARAAITASKALRSAGSKLASIYGHPRAYPRGSSRPRMPMA
jgi:pantothenate kinase